MWYTKISGIYWHNKKRITFVIDEPSEKAYYMYNGLLESLQYEENIVFEIVEEKEYYKKPIDNSNST